MPQQPHSHPESYSKNIEHMVKVFRTAHLSVNAPIKLDKDMEAPPPHGGTSIGITFSDNEIKSTADEMAKDMLVRYIQSKIGSIGIVVQTHIHGKGAVETLRSQTVTLWGAKDFEGKKPEEVKASIQAIIADPEITKKTIEYAKETQMHHAPVKHPVHDTAHVVPPKTPIVKNHRQR